MIMREKKLLVLLVALLCSATSRADDWPAYVTDVVVFATKKDNRESCIKDWRNKGYTVIEKDLNDGAVTFAYNEIYFAYKTGSRESTNKGYITDLVVLNVGSAPETWQHNGRTYHKSPYEDNCHYGYSFDGNLNYLVSEAWDLYLYYTKDNFDDNIFYRWNGRMYLPYEWNGDHFSLIENQDL